MGSTINILDFVDDDRIITENKEGLPEPTSYWENGAYRYENIWWENKLHAFHKTRLLSG